MASNFRRSLPGKNVELVHGIGKISQKRKSVAPKLGLPSGAEAQIPQPNKSNKISYKAHKENIQTLGVIHEEGKSDENIDTRQNEDTKGEERKKSILGYQLKHNKGQAKNSRDSLISNNCKLLKPELKNNQTSKIPVPMKAPTKTDKRTQLFIAISEESKAATLSIGQEKYSPLISPFPLPPNVICIDEFEDSSKCYAPDFMTYLRALETQQSNKSCEDSFELKHKRRLLRRPRATLTDWMIEVGHYFQLSQECMYKSFHLLDKIVSRSCKLKTEAKDIQLVGITCLYIATKLEEYYPADTKELIRLTEDSWKVKDILKMELSILNEVNFQPITVDPMPFLNRNILAASCSILQWNPSVDKKIFYELCILLVDSLVTNYELWENLPSKKAAAAVYAALRVSVESCKGMCTPKLNEECDEVFKYDILSEDNATGDPTDALVNKGQIWNATLVYYSGYKESQINLLTRQMLDLLLKLLVDAKKNTGSDSKDKECGLRKKYLSNSQHSGLLRRPEINIDTITSVIKKWKI